MKITISRMKNIVKSGVFGLLACFLAFGMLAPALASDDRSPGEFAMLEEFHRTPYKQIVWTPDELREGAERAQILNREK